MDISIPLVSCCNFSRQDFRLTVVIGQFPEEFLVIEEMLKIETEPLEHSGLLALLDLPKVLGCREKSFLDYS